MDLSGGPAEVPTESSEMPSMFGNGGLDGPQNPGRIRPGEDQAAMLSRLLSVAAAATAASLVGNAEEAITQAQDVGGDNGGDGSFEAFLRALQNGRLEAALRNGGNEMGGGTIPPDPNAEGGVLSLNFFRMFRFGSTPATARDREEHAQNSEEGAPEPGRMVPVIIVGIRSVPPRESTEGGEGNNRPGPFFDALANLPVSLPGSHRRNRPSGSTGGTHRRAASLGTPGSPSRVGTSPIPDHGINPFAGPHTDTPSGPNPPPTTPAEPAMPPFPTGVYRRNPMEPALVDPFEGDRPARQSLPRRLSNPDMLNPFGIPPGASGDGAARERNSTSGPRPAGQPTGPPEGTRSWIIYVLGGSYPENHPILTTPSLFTDVRFATHALLMPTDGNTGTYI